MAEQSHETATFSKLHHARLYPSGSALQIGAVANLPPSPQGVGDLYFATDTGVLYSTNVTGTAWVAASTAVMVGDAGAGGTAGLVPAPGAGDYASGYYLDAGGNWSDPGSGGGGYTYKGVKCIRSTSDQTLATVSTTNLAWNAEEWDANSMHHLVTNNHRIENFTNGEKYLFTCCAMLGDGGISDNGNGAALRIVHYDNSAATAKVKATAAITYNMIVAPPESGHHLSVEIAVDANDYVYCQVNNQFDASLSLTYNDQESFFSAFRIETA